MHGKALGLFFSALVMTAGVFGIGEATASSNKDENCVVPQDDMSITEDTTLCSGTYEISDRGQEGVIHLEGSNFVLTCDGTVLRGDWQGFGIVTSQERENITVQNCTVENYMTNARFPNVDYLKILNNQFGGSSDYSVSFNYEHDAEDVLFKGNSVIGAGNGVVFGSNATVANVVFEDNTIDVPIDCLVIAANDSASSFVIRGNTIGSCRGEIINITKGSKSTAIIEKNEILDTTRSNVLLQGSQNVTIRENILHRANLQIENSQNNRFERNLIGGSVQLSQDNEIGFGESKNNVFVNNIWNWKKDPGVNWNVRFNNSPQNVFYNNTFYGGGSGLLIEKASPGTIVRNNIFVNPFGNSNRISVATDSVSGFVADYNFFGDEGLTFQWAGANYRGLSEWRAASGQDSRSIEGNPMFINPDVNDFSVDLTSPVIDAGDPAIVYASQDFSGNIRPYGAVGVSDIGAHEIASPTTESVALNLTSSNDRITITIIDRSNNPVGTKYGILHYESGEWLQGDGTTALTPYYASETTWEHANLSPRITYSYQVVATNPRETTVTEPSRCRVGTRTRPSGATPALDRLIRGAGDALDVKSMVGQGAICPVERF